MKGQNKKRQAKKPKGSHKLRKSLVREFEQKRLDGRSTATPKTWAKEKS